MRGIAFGVFGLVFLIGSLAGCKPTENILENAAAQATAIVQQARATALLLGAQATATALIRQALGEPLSTPNPAIYGNLISSTPAILAVQATQTPAADIEPEPSATALSESVELVSVTIAADGGFIMVNYKAPPAVANLWYQGNVSVTDEASGVIYDQIPVMPIIGPLIAQPVELGQAGYVMFINISPGLPVGTSVTVRLGEYIFEHIRMQ